jgi:hypothetical protein
VFEGQRRRGGALYCPHADVGDLVGGGEQLRAKDSVDFYSGEGIGRCIEPAAAIEPRSWVSRNEFILNGVLQRLMEYATDVYGISSPRAVRRSAWGTSV